MSQAKVDRYKEEKKNRKQLIKKAKREWMAVKAGLTVGVIALVAWVGIAAYQAITTPDPTGEVVTYEVNTSALDDYMSDLAAE